jgi:zinc/manganese transport system permease protein
MGPLGEMLSFPFMVNALRAGTIVAVVAGAIGYFMVLRRQGFAGHALAVIGFPGAAGVTLLGISTTYGYFAACIGAALIIAALPATTRRGGLGGFGEESALIGTVLALALACGFLFVSLYKGFLNGLNNLLFGTITGITTTQVTLLLVAALLCLLVLAILGRPLLFVSVDPDLARARGVPVQLVNALFLVLLGIAAAGSSQVIGSLLVFALLVTPAATAHQLTARPALGIILSIGCALGATWMGETLAFYSPYPIGFWVTTLAFTGYLLAVGWRVSAERSRRLVASVNQRCRSSRSGNERSGKHAFAPVYGARPARWHHDRHPVRSGRVLRRAARAGLRW